MLPGSRRPPLPQTGFAASRDPGRKFRRARPRAGQGTSPRTPGASSAQALGPPRPAESVAKIWGGAQRRRVWRPQTLPYDGAPARERREHAPGAAGALPRAGPGPGPGGGGFLGAATPQVGSDCNWRRRVGRGGRCLPGRRPGSGRGACPQALSRPLSGRGLDPGDRNRARGNNGPVALSTTGP